MQISEWDRLLGERIRVGREQIGIGPTELAKRMRRRGHRVIVHSVQYEIEAGRRRVRAAEVADYCRELQVPPWWLLGMAREEAAELEAAMAAGPPA